MTAELANGRQVLLLVVADRNLGRDGAVVRDAPRVGLVSAAVGLAVAVTGGHIGSRHRLRNLSSTFHLSTAYLSD
jgi:hypothetical protein